MFTRFEKSLSSGKKTMGKPTTPTPDSNKKKHKKSKRSMDEEAKKAEAPSTENSEVDLLKLIKRQQEACDVIEQKKNIIAANQLSYLEYIEMQEEIARLVDLRNNFQAKINALRKQRKSGKITDK